jgi:hypothetical protein
MQSRALEEACVDAKFPYVIFGSATEKASINGKGQTALASLAGCTTDVITVLYASRNEAAHSWSWNVAVREFDDYCARIDEWLK